MRRIKINKIDIGLIGSRILKNSKNTIKLFQKLSLITIIIQVIVFSSIVISEPKLTKSIIDKLSRRVLWSFETFEIEDYGNYIKELLISLNPTNKSLERLYLSIDIENLAGLDCSRKYNSDFYKDKVQSIKENCGKYWFKGKLSHDGDIYNVKLRTKGDRAIHFNTLKNMSLKADIKGLKRFKGMEEFSIQTPIIRNYSIELFAAKLMRDEGIISPRHFYVKFFINGEYKGIRHLEEGFTRELIEFNKRRYGPLFSLEEKFGKKYKEAIFDLHDSKFWEKGDFSMNLANQARTILESSKTNKEFINKYFDLDKWAKYFAIVDAFGLWHGAMPSVKYFLNPTTGLIEPVFYDGHFNATRILENYNFYKIYNNQIDVECSFICDPNENFYINFFGTKEEPNNLFYAKYLKNLKRITNQEFFIKNINPKWQSLSNERGNLYKELWRIDRISNPGIMPHIAPWKKLTKRIYKINKDLSDAELVKPQIIIDEQKSKIINIKNNYSDISQVIKLRCLENGFESNNFILIKNKQVGFENNKINDCALNNIVYSLNDFQTSFNVKDGYVLDYDLRARALNNPNLLEGNKFTFERGINKINNSILLNQKDIIFSKGSIICLDEKSIIHIKNSKVIFEGTTKNPVIIKNCLINNSKSGSLIIERSDVLISNLIANKLTKPEIKLRSLDGALNFIDSKITIDSITSQSASSEDAINFINSNVQANFINIFNTFSDGIDSDFSKINIKNISCKNIGNDCFDASFTRGLLGVIKAKNVGDKVISVGESSDIYIEKTEINNSEIGLAVKDSSNLVIDKYLYSDVKLPITAYIKKEEFGSPNLLINSISSNESKYFLISNDSNVTIQGVNQKTKLNSKDVEDLLYGNKFGIKTIR